MAEETVTIPDEGSKDFFISFDTKANPGKIEAIRVRLDNITITDMNKPLAVNLPDHPLWKDLVKYVKANS